MPPRLPALTAHVRPQHNISPLVACLLPFLQTRNASILGSLSDVPSAYNKRIRRGRGPSSGHGKTSGRGHKGQKQHGKVPARFQGGQTPMDIVHGKRGYVNQYDFPEQPPEEFKPLNCPANLLIISLVSRSRCHPST
jgi:large subunit ribosomal protein L15